MGELTIGIVGTGGRGRSFKPLIDEREGVHVEAVCDVDPDALERGRRVHDAPVGYREYDAMLDEAGLDAVIIGTPVPYHVPQSIAALDRDLHVLCEVPAATSVEECRELVVACERSQGTFTMTENFLYMRPNRVVKNMVDDGLFGELYYAEAEYLHELKALNETTPWRRKWQTGINGISYPTHSLGTLLDWMDDRIARVTCAGSGHHYRDPRGDRYEQEDTTVMLGETERGRLIKVRLDMLSERPDGIDNYQLQGTRGCYESARTECGTNRVWLESLEDAEDSIDYEWLDLREFEPDYLPDKWQLAVGVSGGSLENNGLAFRERVLKADYVMLDEIFDSLLAGDESPIDIHSALDMTLPGLISQQSIANDGKWMVVPDSRKW